MAHHGGGVKRVFPWFLSRIQLEPAFLTLVCCGSREPRIGCVRLDFCGGQCVFTQPDTKIYAFVDACGTLSGTSFGAVCLRCAPAATAWLARRLATKSVRNAGLGGCGKVDACVGWVDPV